MTWSLVVAALVAAFAVVPASADETCHAFASQFAKERMCVSSVLAPQGGSDYAPKNLADGNPATAWCEVPGTVSAKRSRSASMAARPSGGS